jgi:hypothetical protein
MTSVSANAAPLSERMEKALGETPKRNAQTGIPSITSLCRRSACRTCAITSVLNVITQP